MNSLFPKIALKKKDNGWASTTAPFRNTYRSAPKREQLFQVLAADHHPQVVEIWNNVFMEFNRWLIRKLPATR
jgi:alanyl-tRNA synthetase